MRASVLWRWLHYRRRSRRTRPLRGLDIRRHPRAKGRFSENLEGAPRNLEDSQRRRPTTGRRQRRAHLEELRLCIK